MKGALEAFDDADIRATVNIIKSINRRYNPSFELVQRYVARWLKNHDDIFRKTTKKVASDVRNKKYTRQAFEVIDRDKLEDLKEEVAPEYKGRPKRPRKTES